MWNPPHWYLIFNGICMKYALLFSLFVPMLLTGQIQKTRENDPIYGAKYVTYKLLGKDGDLLPITLIKYKNTDDHPPYEFSFVQEISLQQYLKAGGVTTVEVLMKDGRIIPLDEEQLEITTLQVAFTGKGYKALVTSELTNKLINLLQKARGIRVNQYGEGVKFYDDPNSEDAKEFAALVKFFKSELFDIK